MPITRHKKIEVFDDPILILDHIDEISDFRRYIFNNAYGDFLAEPKTGKVISAQEYFDAAPDKYVPIEEMDSVKESDLSNEIIIYRHRERMKQLLIEQLVNEDGQIALLKIGNRIKGMTYGYRATLSRIFELEWANKYIYSNHRMPEFDRNFDEFLSILNEASAENFKPEDIMYCWNCIGVDPDIKGSKIIRKPFFKYVQKKFLNEDSFVLIDFLENSKVHSALKKINSKIIDHFLNNQKLINNKEIIGLAKLNDFAALSIT